MNKEIKNDELKNVSGGNNSTQSIELNKDKIFIGNISQNESMDAKIKFAESKVGENDMLVHPTNVKVSFDKKISFFSFFDNLFNKFH